MKRLRLLITIIVLALSLDSAAQTYFEYEGVSYKIIREADESTTFGTVVVTEKRNGFYEGTVVVPNAVKQTSDGYDDNYRVVGIDSRAFKGSTMLERVILPIGIEIIGESAFSGCSNLSTVDIPVGCALSSIGECCFQDSGLETINLRGHIDVIPRMAFMNCNRLKEIILPESLQVIGISAFLQCSSLTHVDLPQGLSEIKTSAFAYSGLKSINIPSKVTIIPMAAFQMCKSLTSVGLSQYTTKIEADAFSCNLALSEINLPMNMESIDSSAFVFCPNAPDYYVSPEEKSGYKQLIESGMLD